jgi:hypothetical protein
MTGSDSLGGEMKGIIYGKRPPAVATGKGSYLPLSGRQIARERAHLSLKVRRVVSSVLAEWRKMWLASLHGIKPVLLRQDGKKGAVVIWTHRTTASTPVAV